MPWLLGSAWRSNVVESFAHNYSETTQAAEFCLAARGHPDLDQDGLIL